MFLFKEKKKKFEILIDFLKLDGIQIISILLNKMIWFQIVNKKQKKTKLSDTKLVVFCRS